MSSTLAVTPTLTSISSHAAALSEAVLSVNGLGKEYRLYDHPRDRLRALLTGRSKHRSHWALRDATFALHRGQCMGVIGDNGAGKSTLLKLIVGTLQPSNGSIKRAKRVTAILELGAGFHPDFSGRDNLYFGGSLIGIAADEMKQLEDSIIAFSELGEAIDRPVKTYSSGMVVRLAFALVTAVEPDVLIIDEALAVGDQHFQKKCVERITSFRNNGCTILFCSHSLYHVRHLCNVALWLDGGQVRAFGETETVLAAYELHTRARDAVAPPTLPDFRSADAVQPNAEDNADTGSQSPVHHAEDGTQNHATGGTASLVSLTIANLGDGEPPLLNAKDLMITVVARVHTDECPSIAIMLEQSHGVGITSMATHAEGIKPTRVGHGLWQITLTFTDLPLHTGDYVVSAYLFDSQGLVVYDEWYHHQHFKYVNPSLTPGLVRLPHQWS
jgi:lipopolysaccharide transport system ATP-binding protein